MQKIKNLLSRLQVIIPWAKNHKIFASIILLVLIYGIYSVSTSLFGSDSETKYVLSRVRSGDITTTVTGTGQVSASNQIELKAKTSGKITTIGARTGDELKAGAIIAKVDTRDIDLSLQSARISLQKLTRPTDATTRIQAENSLDDAKESLEKAEADLGKAYEDALTSVSSTYVDLPEIVNGMSDILYGSDGFLSDKNAPIFTGISQSYRNSAGVNFDIAKNNYKNNSDTYRSTARTQSTSTIDSLLKSTYDTVSKTADALKNAKLAIDYIKDRVSGQYATSAQSAQSNVNSWTTKNNVHLTDLLSARTQITSAKNAVESAKRNVREKTENLLDIQNGSDNLDIESQRINLAQKQLEYENYVTRAPFDGVLAKLDVKTSDDVSNGTSIGVFITKQKIANITLNEVDASKAQVGQLVELTFDAVDNLTATGTVASVDLVGTVSQGVVTYGAQITFDSPDEQIKPGMSVSAVIVTESKQNVLFVPASAIKTRNGKSYVQIANVGRAQREENGTTTRQWQGRASSTRSMSGNVMNQTGVSLNTPPIEKEVTLGISNDTMAEIVEGLTEGQFVVSRTITGTTQTTSTAPSLINIGRTGGNNRTR